MDAQEPEPEEEREGPQGEERRWRYQHDGVGPIPSLPPSASHDRSFRRQMRIRENFRRSQARWALSVRRSPDIVNWAQYKPNDLEKIMETLMSFEVQTTWIEQVFIKGRDFLHRNFGGFVGDMADMFWPILGYCIEGFNRSRSLQNDLKLLKDQLVAFRNQLEEVQVYVGPEAAGLDVADLSSIESSHDSDV